MSTFHFVSYEFTDGEAVFRYRDDIREYAERVRFPLGDFVPDDGLLDRALFLAFILVGTSYYKVSPTTSVSLEQGMIDDWQAKFFTEVYQEGLSQFAYESNLHRSNLAAFGSQQGASPEALSYAGEGILSLQSGGKDSLLIASMLDEKGTAYTPWYVSSSDSYPVLLDNLGSPLLTAKRSIDREALRVASQEGGLNGHVPVTYIVLSLAVIQAILLGKNTVMAAIGNEGEEPHGWIDDLAVNHQWSKTWQAEQLFAYYVERYISPDIAVGSPLRSYSELKIAQLFVDHAWDDYGAEFSSCNLANYAQGADNQTLNWCGECPKCANAYLLFAPFIEPSELQKRLGGDLFQKPELHNIFKGLLGVEERMKPLECVGEVDELRQAYHMSQLNGHSALPFSVPGSNFDKDVRYSAQTWATELLV